MYEVPQCYIKTEGVRKLGIIQSNQVCITLPDVETRASIGDYE